MTREELLDVSSLSFEQMWFRVWLSRGDPAREFFAKKLEKFSASFLREDGGAALLRLVRATAPGGVLLWEPPKGRAQSAREVDLICAVREVAEETGVEKAEYRLLPAAKCRVDFESAGTRYSCTYYLALANPRLASGAAPLPPRSPEVGAIAWHDILSARAIDAACGGPAPLAPLLGTAFRLLRRLRRGRRGRRGRPLPPGLAELA
jgi:8-oxo-dGTP pyrophosphatase MutT (NUDIX family)